MENTHTLCLLITEGKPLNKFETFMLWSATQRGDEVLIERDATAGTYLLSITPKDPGFLEVRHTPSFIMGKDSGLDSGGLLFKERR